MAGAEYGVVIAAIAAQLAWFRRASNRFIALALGVGALAIVLERILASYGMGNHWLHLVWPRLQAVLLLGFLTPKPLSKILCTAAPLALISWAYAWLTGVTYIGIALVDVSIFGALLIAARHTPLQTPLFVYALPTVVTAPFVAMFGMGAESLQPAFATGAWRDYLMWYQVPLTGRLVGAVLIVTWLLRGNRRPVQLELFAI